MRPRGVTTGLIIAALVALFVLTTIRFANLREASVEAAYPALGQFVDVGGRKIHVIVIGSGPDLVLIHGAGANARDLDVALSEILSDRFRLFIVDRPGHGWSDRLGEDFEGALTTAAESPVEQARALS